MRLISAAIGMGLLVAALPVWASHAFYVGKNLTEDGGVLIGGTGEEVSSHWLEIAAADYPADATVDMGVTDAAAIPGELTAIA